MMIIINIDFWENFETGLNGDSKFIWLQYKMAVEKQHGNLMLHTEKLYQRGKTELQESVSVNTTWNSLFRLLARMHCQINDT